MITKRRLEVVFMGAVKRLQELAPKDTGNLAYNAIKYRWEGDKFVIYVDMGDVGITEPRVQGIAPYMPFTNEVWVSDRWKGKQNPNEGWWNKAVEDIVVYMTKRLKGKVEND